MPTLREEAEYLRLTLAMGLLDKSAAIAWADRTIISLDAPPIEVIDVALAGNQPIDEVIRLLAAVRGEGDGTLAAHRVLGLLLNWVINDGISVRSAVDMLWAYSNRAKASEDVLYEARNFSYQLEDAESGYYGTIESVRDDLISFLRQKSGEPI